MEPLSVFEVLREVITSWQVIAATIVLILFFNVIFYVANTRHRPMSMSMRKLTPKNKKLKTSKSAESREDQEEQNDNDELGLEEE